MTDEDLQRAVADELAWDPKVDNSAVAVEANDGVITLRGTVGNLPEKTDAKLDAQRLAGVLRVDDELEVALLDENRRPDADLRGAVLRALELDSRVPASVDAQVDAAWVTLTGTATWQFQREEAEQVAGRVPGVRGVGSDIKLVPAGPSAGDVKQAITQAMQRSARLDASKISVECSSGTVTLSGTVSSWADHDDAIIAAWKAPGVVNVIDDVQVTQ